MIAAETEESDIQREVAKAETDVEAVRQRAVRNQERLDSGAITSAKDLEGLQHEIGSLARRQSDLEDLELEILERLEDAQTRLARNRQQVTDLDQRLTQAQASRDTQFAEIDRDVAYLAEQRGRESAGLPQELLALYDRLRADNSGVGAAALKQRRCEGCRLELNNTELAQIRAAAPNEVLRCDECRRILVRTPESGL